MKVISKVTKDLRNGLSLVEGSAYDVHQIVVGGFRTSVQLVGFTTEGLGGCEGIYLGLESAWFQTEDGQSVMFVQAVSGKAAEVFGESPLYIEEISQENGVEVVECRVRGYCADQPQGYMSKFPKSDFRHLPVNC